VQENPAGECEASCRCQRFTSKQGLIMGKKLIPDEIREKVTIIVEIFNQQEFKTTPCMRIEPDSALSYISRQS